MSKMPKKRSIPKQPSLADLLKATGVVAQTLQSFNSYARERILTAAKQTLLAADNNQEIDNIDEEDEY